MAGASMPLTASPPSPSGATVAPRLASSLARSPGRGDRTSTSPRALAAMNSAVGRSASSLPRPMMIKWSAVSAISLIRWLETKTVRPSAASDLKSCLIQWTPSGSRPLTGSSNISTGGSPSSARAMPSRCFMPSENPLTRRSATLSSPVSRSTSVTRRRPMPLLCATDSTWA